MKKSKNARLGNMVLHCNVKKFKQIIATGFRF